MVTTVAPTIPVLAASSIPTIVTEMPSPPRNWPNKRLRLSRRLSAILARSSVMPMKTNSGTAINVWLFMIPNTRLGMVPRKAASKIPSNAPTQANISAIPPRENATGNPASSTITTTTNIKRAIHSIRSRHSEEHRFLASMAFDSPKS